MPKFRLSVKRPPEEPLLEIEARRLANVAARQEYGEAGFCFQMQRIGRTREFRCYVAHQPAKAGMLVGKTVHVVVPE